MSEAGVHRARTFSRRSVERTRRGSESRTTVIVALVANAVIAVAKLGGGLIAGSAAMLAEAAHSVADTTNQLFLLSSFSLASREPSPSRPFGHGQERYLWTFLAAVTMFAAGAAFAIGFSVYRLLVGSAEGGGYLIAYAVLAVAFVSEGISWARAVRQTRRSAASAGEPVLAHARRSRDPNLKLVLFEDTAALIGVVLAAAGLAADQATSLAVFDPAAGILIGALLVSVAIWIGRDASRMLVGAAANPDERRAIEEVIEEFDEVATVKELLSMVLAPNALLVAARVNLRDGIEARRVEEVSSRIDERIREAVPDVTEVFLDATPGGRLEQAAEAR